VEEVEVILEAPIQLPERVFPEINQDLFGRIEKIIESQPEQFNMASYESDQRYDGSSCGTTRCIAGWGIALAHQDRFGASDQDLDEMANEIDSKPHPNNHRSYEALGAEVLGLTRMEAQALFCRTGDDEAKDFVHAFATDPAEARRKLRERFHFDRYSNL
jgi:hypothetical protein